MRKIVKIVFLVTLGVLLLANVALANSDMAKNILSTSGKIVSVNKHSITVEGKGSVAKIVLNIAPDTFIVDGKDGATVDKAQLKVGDAVVGYYTPAMTKSLPPQTRAKAIVVSSGDDNAMYFIAGQVDKTTDGVRVLNTNCDQYITITNEVLFYPEQIKKNQPFLAWYRINAMSMPAQSRATKVLLLEKKSIDMNVSLQAGVAALSGKEIQIDVNKGEIYLPAREAAQALGYNVVWQNNTVSLEKTGMQIDFMPTSNVFVKNYQPIIILPSAKVIGGKTYLPLDFFTDVLGLKVRVNNNHV